MDIYIYAFQIGISEIKIKIRPLDIPVTLMSFRATQYHNPFIQRIDQLRMRLQISEISVIHILFQLFLKGINMIIRIFHPSPISGITLITPCSTTAAPTYQT